MDPRLLSVTLALGMVVPVQAFTISFSNADFASLSPTFSNVTTFSYSITVEEPLVAGGVYSNPDLSAVDYSIFGILDTTPSGFPAFNLVRSITGADFYGQGSSLNFQISPTADLQDGLQFSELTGTDPVFVFDGREVGTGRYHPSLLELNADGTGSLRNSNNMGGVNPGSGLVVDVGFGDEYITELTFVPASFELVAAIPEPSRALLVFVGLCSIGISCRRRRPLL